MWKCSILKTNSSYQTDLWIKHYIKILTIFFRWGSEEKKYDPIILKIMENNQHLWKYAGGGRQPEKEQLKYKNTTKLQ